VAEIRAAIRQTDRPIEGTSESHTHNVDNNCWHDGLRRVVSSMASTLSQLPSIIPSRIPRASSAIMSRAHIFSIVAIILLFDTRILLRDAIFSHKFMIQRISRRGSQYTF
jgi:hypothetical protein